MSFAARVDSPPVASRGLKCGISRLLDSIQTSDEQQALEDMLDNPSWGHKAIFEAVRQEGFSVSIRSIERHRRSECGCKHAA